MEKLGVIIILAEHECVMNDISSLLLSLMLTFSLKLSKVTCFANFI